MWWIFGLFGFMYIAASSFSGVSALIVLMIGATVGVLTRIFGKANNESETQVVKNLKQTIAELEARLGKVENVVRALLKKNYAAAAQDTAQETSQDSAQNTAHTTNSETTPERITELTAEATAKAQSDQATTVLAPLEFHATNASNSSSNISSSISTNTLINTLTNTSTNTSISKEDVNKKDVSKLVLSEVALASVTQANASAITPIERPFAPDLALTKQVDSNEIDSSISSAEKIPSSEQVISATSKVDASSSAQNTNIPNQNRQTFTPRPPSKPWREILPAPISNFLFGGNALVKVGVLILFLGFAFLLRYTAERVTVPIELRYVSVLLSGVGLLALGWFLRHKRRDYALIMQGMAIGVFYLTILSAMKMHQLISYEAGFAFMLAVSLLSAALSVLQKAPMLAIVAALEGFITPILTSTGENKPMGLFLYLSILDIGIFCIAWFNAWRVLNLIAFVGTFTLSLGWASKHYTHAEYDITQLFLIFFFILFTTIGVLFARRTLLEARVQINAENDTADALENPALSPLAALKQVGRVDSALVFGTPITAFGLQYTLMQPFEYGAAFSALIVGFFYLLLGRLVYSKEKQGLALLAESYVIIAAIFATLAIPLGLEGTWTSAAWAVEGAGMYWLGIRQARPYARAFAFVVLVGASMKLLYSMTMSTLPMTPLLEGSLLGPVLLALSAFTMWRLYLKTASNLGSNSTSNSTSNSVSNSTSNSVSSSVSSSVAKWEAQFSVILPWIGTAALCCLPWMLLIPSFAAAAVAVMAVVLGYLGLRYSLPNVRVIAGVMQAFSFLSFLQTLHFNQAIDVGAPLADGWRGMIAAVVIAVSILVNAARHMLKAKQQAEAQGLPPNWSWINGIAVVTAFALLHMAMLFVLEYAQVAWIWPITSCMVLWAALKMSHIPLVIFSFVMQLISAAIYVSLGDVNTGAGAGAANFVSQLFIIPLSLAMAAWWSADRIRVEAVFLQKVLSQLSISDSKDNTKTVTSSESSSESPSLIKPWTNAWCAQPVIQWFLVIWGLGCWLSAWMPEIESALNKTQLTSYLMSAYVLFAIGTSGFMLFLAKMRQWTTMGAMSIVGLGLMVVASLAGMSDTNTAFIPSMYLGWLMWPLALGWHVWSTKLQQQWLNNHVSVQKIMHVVGFWFFLILAASEVQIRLGLMTERGTTWALLGWIFVPTLVLWFIGAKGLSKRWPLNTFRTTYVETASTPVAIYLFMWCCITNIVSAGNASPLPYIPLFNPLEIAQVMILLCLVLWWRHLSETAFLRRLDGLMKYVLAISAFALLTGSVLRSVHHFAGVAWDANILFDSRLAQAALSITWAICGVALMLFGNRKISRGIWMAGATLLGIVVIKLFLIELADRGGLYRIVSFIGVGIALLVVGYFAPVPVKKEEGTILGEPSDLSDLSEPSEEAV